MSENLQGEDWIESREKRALDVAVATTVLPLFMTASALGAAAFYAESRINPLLYQRRLGRGNRLMRTLKLRSMPFNHDFSDSSNGYDDVRASDVGKTLRKYRIDEMPQVLQILSGEMSFVGPRPLVAGDVERTMDLLSPSQQRDWLKARSIPKPGWANEFGDVAKQLVPQSEDYLLARVDRDCRYLSAASYAMDTGIIQSRLESLAKIPSGLMDKFGPNVANNTQP